jgi:hypothetical protein
VIDAKTQTLLQDVLRRESRSLLQYLTESFPWTTSDKQAAVATLQRLAEEERESAARVADYLRRHQIPLPYLGAFPMEFTTINFIGLDYAVPLLVQAGRGALANLERDLHNLRDPDARALVQELAAVEGRHIKELEALAEGLPAATLR